MREKKDNTSASPLSAEDKALIDFFAGLRRNSLDTLEAAARQLIGLVTTLLGLFFGVLAFKDEPAYLATLTVQVIGTLSALGYIVTLFTALAVVLPRHLDIPQYDLTAMRELLSDLYKHKSRYLSIAQFSFALGTLALFALIIALLYHL